MHNTHQIAAYRANRRPRLVLSWIFIDSKSSRRPTVWWTDAQNVNPLPVRNSIDRFVDSFQLAISSVQSRITGDAQTLRQLDRHIARYAKNTVAPRCSTSTLITIFQVYHNTQCIIVISGYTDLITRTATGPQLTPWRFWKLQIPKVLSFHFIVFSATRGDARCAYAVSKTSVRL